MTTSSFKDAYTSTRLSKENQEKLQEKFQDFGSVFSATLDLIKTHFWKGFGLPFLWMLLIDTVFVIFTISVTILATAQLPFVEKLWTAIELGSTATPPSPTAEETVTFLTTFFASLIIPSIISGLFRYWLQVKQYAILNNTNVSGIWQTNGNYIGQAAKGVLGYIIISLMILPITLVGFSMLSYGYISLIATLSNYAIDFSQFGFEPLNVGASIAMIILGLVIASVSQFVYAFVGLFEQIIIHEDATSWQAITQSFRISRQKLWANILRWFLFLLVIMAISAGVSFVFSMVSSVFQLAAFSQADISQVDSSAGFSPELTWLYVVSLAFSFLSQIITQIITWVFLTAFTYSAFYNFRHTVVDIQEEGVDA